MTLANVTPAQYANIRKLLEACFPDPKAHVTDAMLDATVLGMWRDWHPEYASVLPPPPATLPASPIGPAASNAGIVGYYVANATHTRMKKDGTRMHAFTGHLPMAHVVLPPTGMIAQTTALGVVDADGVLYGSVHLLNENLSGSHGFKPCAYAELVTPPRGFNQERFAAVAVYLLYDHPHDTAPSSYLFEAGLATGGPRVPFYGADVDQPIKLVRGQYVPTPMSTAEELYEGEIFMKGRRLSGFRVSIRDAAAEKPKVTVMVSLEVTDDAPKYTDPAALRLEAAERVALIAAKLGVPFSDNGLANFLAPFFAVAGEIRPWAQRP